jgi:adenylyltransferase/sulfurtransferase
VGVLASVAHLVACFQATEAMKILIGTKKAVDRRLWKIDLWNRHFQPIHVEHLKSSPCDGCREGHYPYLKREVGTRTVALCGRNAVQIYRSEQETVDFKSLASKLAGQVKVEYNDYVFRILPRPYQIIVFSNGRAIVKGTEDAGQAKSLYARYVGS